MEASRTIIVKTNDMNRNSRIRWDRHRHRLTSGIYGGQCCIFGREFLKCRSLRQSDYGCDGILKNAKSYQGEKTKRFIEDADQWRLISPRREHRDVKAYAKQYVREWTSSYTCPA